MGFRLLPLEIIYYISRFINPLEIMVLSETCLEGQNVFSASFWHTRCLEKGLQPWDVKVSYKQVYIADFFFSSQKAVLVKKAAMIGRPQSKLALLTSQPKYRDEEYSISYSYVPEFHYSITSAPGYIYISHTFNRY